MDREHFPSVPWFRARPIQGILRALVRHAQGAARRQLRHAGGRSPRALPQLLHPGPLRHLLRLPHLRRMTVLTSKENPKVKHWAKLASDARYRRSEGRTLLEGPHLVAAWRRTRTKAAAIIVTEQALEKKEISDLAGMTPVIVSEGVFGSIVEA